MERVKGIEPSYEAWEAAVLPLNYTRSSRDYRQHLQAQPPMPVWLWSDHMRAHWATVAAAEKRRLSDTLQPHGRPSKICGRLGASLVAGLGYQSWRVRVFAASAFLRCRQ